MPPADRNKQERARLDDHFENRGAAHQRKLAIVHLPKVHATEGNAFDVDFAHVEWRDQLKQLSTKDLTEEDIQTIVLKWRDRALWPEKQMRRFSDCFRLQETPRAAHIVHQALESFVLKKEVSRRKIKVVSFSGPIDHLHVIFHPQSPTMAKKVRFVMRVLAATRDNFYAALSKPLREEIRRPLLKGFPAFHQALKDDRTISKIIPLEKLRWAKVSYCRDELRIWGLAELSAKHIEKRFRFGLDRRWPS